MKLLASLLAILGFLFAGTTYALEAPDNLYIIGERAWSDPHKIYMGPDLDNGLYFFVQKDGSGLWSGVETFKRPTTDNVSDGYGAYPIRIWGSNFLVEKDGTMVARGIVTDKIVLAKPITRPGGGIYWDQSDLGTYLTRWGDQLLLVHNGRVVESWR